MSVPKVHSDHNIEKNALSILIQAPAQLDDDHGLTGSHFTKHEHQQLFGLLHRRWKDGKSLDTPFLLQEIVGDSARYGTLLQDFDSIELAAPSTANLDHYVSILEKHRQNRQFQQVSRDIAQCVEHDNHEAIPKILERAGRIAAGEQAKASKEKAEAFHVQCAVDLLVRRLSCPEPAEVFPWPGGVDNRHLSKETFGVGLLPTLAPPNKWPNTHKQLGMWFPGRLGVLVGSTGSGKTAWAVQVAEAVAQYGAPVLYASAELDRVELAARFISLRSAGDALEPAMREGVPWASILAMKTAEPELIEAGRTLVQECPNLYLWAPPSSQRTIEDLAAMTKAISKAHGGKAPFIVVDYVQRWAPDSVDTDKRLAVSGLSARLRELSRPDDDGGWPGAAILALSSTARTNYKYLRDVEALTLAHEGGHPRVINKEGESGSGKYQPPVDLVGLGKETGELEYDAPLVMCLASNQGVETDPMGRRAALLVTAKNRHGHQGGSIGWTFLAAVGRFYEGATKDTKSTTKDTKSKAESDATDDPSDGMFS